MRNMFEIWGIISSTAFQLDEMFTIDDIIKRSENLNNIQRKDVNFSIYNQTTGKTIDINNTIHLTTLIKQPLIIDDLQQNTELFFSLFKNLYNDDDDLNTSEGIILIYKNKKINIHNLSIDYKNNCDWIIDQEVLHSVEIKTQNQRFIVQNELLSSTYSCEYFTQAVFVACVVVLYKWFEDINDNTVDNLSDLKDRLKSDIGKIEYWIKEGNTFKSTEVDIELINWRIYRQILSSLTLFIREGR